MSAHLPTALNEGLMAQLLDFRTELAQIDARASDLRKKIQAIETLVDPSPIESAVGHRIVNVPAESSRYFGRLIRDIISTMIGDFTAHDVLNRIRDYRPEITSTAQFGSVMKQLRDMGYIEIVAPRAGSSGATYRKTGKPEE